jgi:hypothetical protein
MDAKKLSDGHQHCEEILQQRLEKSRLGDPAGNLARAMSQDHRCLAITGYMLDYDIDAFRKHLSASAKGQLELWNRKQNGEEIFHHFVNVGSYRYLFDALAAATFDWQPPWRGLWRAQFAMTSTTTLDSI